MKEKQIILQNKGMNRDLSVSKIGESSAYENRNIRILSTDKDTMLSVTNERGNKKIENITIKGTLLGHAVLNNYIILFTTEGQGQKKDRIYRVEYNGTTFHSILLYEYDLNFSLDCPIETIVDYEMEDIQKVYWIDGRNVLRFLNFSDAYLKKYLESGSLTSDPVFKFHNDNTWFDSTRPAKHLPIVSIKKEDGGENRANGVTQYFITYYNKNGQQTGIVWASPLVYLSPMERGGAADKTNNNKITLQLSGADTSFDYVRLYQILRTAEDGQVVASMIGEASLSDGKTTFVDNGAGNSLIDPTVFLFLGSQEVVPQTLTQKDGTLFLGNLSVNVNAQLKDLEDKIKQFAFRHTNGQSFTQDKDWESNIITFNYSTSNNIEDNNNHIPYTEGIGLYPYENQLKYTNAQISTFKGGEKYRFAIRFIRNNGTLSKAFWIGDKVNSLYPKMREDNHISRALAFCELPDDIIRAAQEAGFSSVELMIAQASSADRAIQAQGLVCPTVFNLYKRYLGQGYAQASWIYRPRGGEYPYKHFSSLNHSSSRYAEMQCSWWKTTPPTPLYYVEKGTNRLANDLIGKGDYTAVRIKVMIKAQSVFTKYWGTITIEYFTKINDPSPAKVHEYNLGNRGMYHNSRLAFIQDWMKAYDDAGVPIGQRAFEQTMWDKTKEALKNASAFSYGTAEYNLNDNAPDKPQLIEFNTIDYRSLFSNLSREYYFVDESIVTLNSPELDYEAVTVDRNKGLKFRIVGAAKLTGNITDYTIKTEGGKYPGERVLQHNFSHNNISSNCEGLSAWTLYKEYGTTYDAQEQKHKKTDSPYAYMMYMWHKEGSIPEFGEEAGKQWSTLKQKTIANLHFSNYSIYNNYDKNKWEVQPDDIRQVTDSGAVLYDLHSNQLPISYLAQVDEMVVMPDRAKYPIYTAESAQSPDSLLSLNNDVKEEKRKPIETAKPIRLTYKPKSHAVISLPSTDKQTLLPYLNKEEKYSIQSVEGNVSVPYYSWDTKVMNYYHLYREVNDADLNIFFKGAYSGMEVLYKNESVNTITTRMLGADYPDADFEKFLNEFKKVQEVKTKENKTNLYIHLDEPAPNLLVDLSSLKLIEVTIQAILKTNRVLSVQFHSSLRMSSVTLLFLDLNTGLQYPGKTFLVKNNTSYTAEVSLPENVSYTFALGYSVKFAKEEVQYMVDDEVHSVLNQYDLPVTDYINLSPDKTVSDTKQIGAFLLNAHYIDPAHNETEYKFINYASNDSQVIRLTKEHTFVKEELFTNTYKQPNQAAFKLSNQTLLKASDKYLFIGEIYKDYDSLAKVDIANDTRYGGVTQSAVESNRFVTAGPRMLLEALATGKKLIGNEGDTYFQRWDSVKTVPRSKEDINQVVEIVSAMIESHLNLDGRTDKDRGVTKLASIDMANYGVLNRVYSQRNNYTVGRDYDKELLSEDYSNTVLWTRQKAANATTDEWTHITMASTMTLDGDKGTIRALRRFQNSILAFQDRGVSEILFNSRTQLSTNDGVPVEIANTGKVDGKRYISNKYGTTNKWSIAEGKAGLYFVDNINKSFCLLGGEGVQNLSERLGFGAWFRTHNKIEAWHPQTFNNLISFYDRVHSDVYLIGKDNDKQAPCLVYNELLGAFSSFYDYGSVPMLVNIDDKWISLKEHQLWLQNEGLYCNFFGKQYPYWTIHRVTPDPYSDKIWTNIEYRADAYRVLDSKGDTLVEESGLIDGGDYEMTIGNYCESETFDYIKVWNEYQQTENMATSPTKKFRTWRFVIPRAVKTDTNKYGLDRIRNPWINLQFKKSYTGPAAENQDLMQLHDITVKYFE